jgi:hypothetical protein
VLFAASCILISLHPSFVASSLIEGNQDISTGLEWIRSWALQVAEADPDSECSSVSTDISIHILRICIPFIPLYVFYLQFYSLIIICLKTYYQ